MNRLPHITGNIFWLSLILSIMTTALIFARLEANPDLYITAIALLVFTIIYIGIFGSIIFLIRLPFLKELTEQRKRIEALEGKLEALKK